jgi:hypothetical protein
MRQHEKDEPIVWNIAIRTVSEANKKEHWTKSSKRHQMQQWFIRRQFLVDERKVMLPCTIRLVRLATRFLDKEDNLPMAFKWIRDEISECIFPEKRIQYVDGDGKLRSLKGRADDSPLIKWEYDQEKSKRMGIRIEIYNPVCQETPK